MDRLARAINANEDIRVVVATTTELTREACRRHELGGVEAIVLGRALTAGCLLATLTKQDDERVRLDFQGKGELGRILVDAHGDGRARGCLERRLPEPVRPDPTRGRPSIASYVGTEGMLVVTRDLGLEKEYQGVIELDTGELDEDCELYLTRSEQLPSVLACEVVLDAHDHVLRAAGILAQTFPDAPPSVLDPVRSLLRGRDFTDLLRQDRSTSDLMGFALRGHTPSLDETALRFACNCGVERALAVVSTLGAAEVEEMADEDEDTEVRCSYCGQVYILCEDQLRDLAAQIRKERS